MEKENVLVMGASTAEWRYSFKATKMLKEYGHVPVCLGKQAGLCAGETIVQQFPLDPSFDTITLYLNPQHQIQYYDNIVQAAPKRVIFNPGTENETLQEILNAHNIPWEEACTLVLLSTEQY